MNGFKATMWNILIETNLNRNRFFEADQTALSICQALFLYAKLFQVCSDGVGKSEYLQLWRLDGMQIGHCRCMLLFYGSMLGLAFIMLPQLSHSSDDETTLIRFNLLLIRIFQLSSQLGDPLIALAWQCYLKLSGYD